MMVQSRNVNFDDPFHGKLVEESFDKLFKRKMPPSTRVAIDRPEVTDVEHEPTGYLIRHELEKPRN